MTAISSRRFVFAKMLMDEDRWNVEKEERLSNMQMAQEDRQRKAQELDTVKQMISSGEDMLGQVTVEKDGPLQ